MSMMATSRFALKKLVGFTRSASVVVPFRHSAAARRGFFSGLTLSPRKLIDRVPHTLCITMTEDPNIQLGEKGKEMSLKIPGIEKIKETDEGVSIFLDLGLNNKNKHFHVADVETDLDKEHNTLIFKVFTWTAGINKGYKTRVNLPKTSIFSEPIKNEIIDGGVMLTLPKQPMVNNNANSSSMTY